MMVSIPSLPEWIDVDYRLRQVRQVVQELVMDLLRDRVSFSNR